MLLFGKEEAEWQSHLFKVCGSRVGVGLASLRKNRVLHSKSQMLIKIRQGTV